MEYLSYIFNIPILQALAVILLIGIAERMGIPIISILKNLLKINGKDTGIVERMGKLEKHFNEETTEGLQRIENAITNGFKSTEEKLDHINEGIIYIKAKTNGK